MHHSLCIFCQMRYIQPFPGQHVSMDPTAVVDVYGLIGTPAIWKEHAALIWRVGLSYLFEEVLSPETVAIIYTQGTAYLGNFLALRKAGMSQHLVSECDLSMTCLQMMLPDVTLCTAAEYYILYLIVRETDDINFELI